MQQTTQSKPPAFSFEDPFEAKHMQQYAKYKVSTFKYDFNMNKWKMVELEAKDVRIEGITQLKFITYNIWFDKHNFNERGIEIRKLLEEGNADFVCLQEVLQSSYSQLLDCDWLRKSYYVSGNSINGYTNLIISKHPCVFFVKPFPTKMGRSLIFAELIINGIPTVVGTVHLESLGNGQLRQTQLDLCFSEFKNFELAFLMGDFNFDWESENKNIIPEYADMWRILYPDDPGYTMPRTPDFLAWRPDRILVKRSKLCRGLTIERIGMDPIPKYIGDEPYVEESDEKDMVLEVRTPSDHYGLKASVEIRSEKGHEESHGHRHNHEHKESKRGNFIWIDGHISNSENMFYLSELEKFVTEKKGQVKGFEKVPAGLEYTLFKLEDFDDLTLILNYLSLYTITNDWRQSLKRITEKFLHEKQSRFKVIIFTNKANEKASKELCAQEGFEKFWIVTSFKEVVQHLFV